VRLAGPFVLAFLVIAPFMALAAHPSYRVARAHAARPDLLAASEEAWRGAETIEWGPAPYETRFRARWNDDGLYLRFDADDDAPWHTMTRRDDHLWDEEVVEIFLDPARSGRDYSELEISPANVVCDVRMVSPWPDKQMDLSWNFEGLVTEVHANRDGEGTTTGWTATAYIPWPAFRTLPSSKAVALPPKSGDAWRFNVFRIKRPHGPREPERGTVAAAWSKPPGESFHVPASFRDFVFVAER
jgi:Carbohydrate family 9 binding domain-like